MDTVATDQLENELLEVEETKAEENAPAPQPSDIPDKFQGKSVEDIVKSYTELEAMSGKQAAELGQLRKFTDSLLDRELSQISPQAKPEETEEELDFIDAPEKSVDALIRKRTESIEKELSETRKERALAKLEKAHSDYESIIGSNEFQQWVSASPVRLHLMQDAHYNANFESANELLNIYKALNPVTTEADKEMKEVEREAKTVSRINEMTTETGSTGQTSGKYFNRLDLINLRATNPRRYAELAPQIRKAYEEGRVK